MAHAIAFLLLAAAAFGMLLTVVQLASTARHRRCAPPRPRRRPGISLLKPLCGIDDDLAGNLACFASLPYPAYELILGVRSVDDPAYPLARACAAAHPGRVRVVVQRGEPGRNPKVNQLVTLAEAARHDILVVSDSNVRVGAGYLDEIAAHFDDPSVGLVTHAVAGVGARRLGAALDNLHLCGSVGPGMIAAKRVARKDIVVGKSMALRRADLVLLGGFEAVRDHLAEDWVLGKRVAELGKRVVVATEPVYQLSRDRSVGEFYRRYQRWSVIHRQAVGRLVFAGEILLNPLVPALAALAVAPSSGTALAAASVAAARMACDGAAARLLAGSLPLPSLLAAPLKDLLIAAAWWHGMRRRHVDWRGNRLEVLPGTLLGQARPRTAITARCSSTSAIPTV